MANDPKDGKGGGLPAANAGAAAGGGGAPGAAAAPCKWDLFVKVHSQERFWPKDPFSVKVCNLTAAGDLGPVDFTQQIQMIAKDSPEAHFCNSWTKHYGVTATVKDLAKEKEWKLAAGRTSKAALAKDYTSVTLRNGDKGARAKHVNLYIRHPLEVHLQLKFKDPENKVLTFPEHFPVQVYAGKSPPQKILQVKTTAEGKLDFEMDRAYNWFTLKFGNSKFLISNGDGTKNTCDLKEWKHKQDLADAKAKFFSPPTQWALIESDWAFSSTPKYIDNTDAYKPAEGKVYVFDPPTKNWVRRIGEAGAPVVLTLDPHWQFVRLEYFDRYFGHADHSHQRVNTPTVFVEGYWSANGKDRQRDGGGFWTLHADKRDQSVHVLPWIRQKDSAGAAKQRPDNKALLMFETKTGTFSGSVDKDTRKLEVLDPVKHKDRLKPSADRLKLYDLPKIWKSVNYFARYKDAAGKFPGKFFEQWDAAGIVKSRSAATPMIFSLDDVVLADSSGNTLKFLAADLFAAFYHRFLQAYNEAGNVSHVGIYKEGWKAAAGPEPVDSGPLKGKDFNYLVDYPNWVRMVAGRSSLFDVFDQRTKGAVIGARAGVRYYNPAASGEGPGNVAPAAGLIQNKYFVMRPYYQATYPDFQAQFLPEPAAPTEKDGRFDMVLLRCCDHDGAGKELFINLSYFRFLFTFLANSTTVGAAQKTYAHDASLNLMKRWNGKDPALANDKRAELQPQNPAKKLWGESIFFVQPVTKKKEAHFEIRVQKIALAGGRQGMSSFDGTGDMDDADSVAPGFSGDPLGFTFAHEFGHGASLPDEYGEWWFNCSDNGPGILCNTPGDPFVEEGWNGDYVPDAAHVVPVSGWGMMAGNVQIRNRYFWHNAEFARKYVDKVPFLVKHGALASYKVPGHPNYPKQTYTYWPIKAAVSKTRGKHGKFDIYLHSVGEDKYTKALLPNLMKTGATVDGILSLLHRVRLRMPAAFVAAANPVPPPLFNSNLASTQLRDAIRNAMIALTGKFYAKGTAKVKTDEGIKDLALSKVLMRFSPRFLIDPKNFNPRDPADTPAIYSAKFNTLAGNIGTHYNIKVLQSGGAAPAPGFNHGKYGLDLVVDLTKPVGVAAAALSAQAKQYFVEMLGVTFDPLNPNIKKEDLKDIAGLVIKTNPDVGNLP